MRTGTRSKYRARWKFCHPSKLILKQAKRLWPHQGFEFRRILYNLQFKARYLYKMTEVPFLYRALSDLLIGTLIVAPSVYAIDSVIPRSVTFHSLTLFGLLRNISLPGPVILFVMGLFWTLLIALSGSTGIGWTW